MDIRPTTLDDFPAIAALTNEFIRGTAVHFGYEPVSADEIADQWRASRDRFPWFTADIDGQFGGYAKAGPWRTRDAYQWTAEAGIYVANGHRGRGVGKALYKTLINALRDRGFHALIGGLTLPNAASVRLHESLGFTYVGSFKEVGYKLNQWHDVGFWQLLLQDKAHTPYE